MTFTFQESAQSVSLASGPPRRAIPALAQYRSISPSSALAASISAVTPSSPAASPAKATAVPLPDRSHELATASAASPLTSLITTLAPSVTNLRANAAPMPLPPPVTTTPAPVTDSINGLQVCSSVLRELYRSLPHRVRLVQADSRKSLTVAL